jgi:hypothetical protein
VAALLADFAASAAFDWDRPIDLKSSTSSDVSDDIATVAEAITGEYVMRTARSQKQGYKHLPSWIRVRIDGNDTPILLDSLATPQRHRFAVTVSARNGVVPISQGIHVTATISVRLGIHVCLSASRAESVCTTSESTALTASDSTRRTDSEATYDGGKQ